MSTEIIKENCRKDQNIKTKFQCQPLPNWVKWLALILIITLFIMACVEIHYLWKLSDIWQAVKQSK